MNAFGIILLVMCCPTYSYGYTDPGTGILLWQGLVAGGMGFLFTTRRTLKHVMKYLMARVGRRSA